MFYIAKVKYQDIDLTINPQDENGIAMIDIPTQEQFKSFVRYIIISATSSYKADQSIHLAYGSDLEEIIFIEPLNLKVVDIKNIDTLKQKAENQYLSKLEERSS